MVPGPGNIRKKEAVIDMKELLNKILYRLGLKKRPVLSKVDQWRARGVTIGENFDGHAYHVAPYYEGFDSLFDFYSYFNLYLKCKLKGRIQR
mgnify:CR=1 FL=1